MTTEVRHSTIDTNGIRMHVAEMGDGFPVIMLHGWPELWYSWRHQLPALAAAGYRAIAPDMRGYGGTDAPAEREQYTMKIICADVAGLMDALGLEQAVIVGHDWGGAALWQFALRYPERVAGLIGLNTPYAPPSAARTTEVMRDAWGLTDRTFYMRYFQTKAAEEEFQADVRTVLAKTFLPYTRAEDFWTFATVGGDGSGCWTNIESTDTFLTPEELDVYAEAFERTGIRGGFNWYRAADLNADEAGRPTGPNIDKPTLMITAEHDRILRPEMAAGMGQFMPNLRTEMVRNCSHWTQQERPEEVNRLMIGFLNEIGVSQGS
jgi:soluble epoxide hydrolase/lipid-phosphate phosphatase